MTTTERRSFVKQLPATFSQSAKGFSAVITSDALDRDGEVLLPQGCNTKDYEAHPTLTVLHKMPSDIKSKLPVGKCEKITRTERKIVGDFSFSPRPADYVGEWFPDYIAGLVAGGAINAVSVEGIAEKNGYRNPTQADFAKYGQDLIGVLSRWRMVDVSLVPMPSNPESLITAVRKGFVTEKAAMEFAGVRVKGAGWMQPPTRAVVRVSVPSFGEDDVRKLVREEIQRMKGRLYA